MAPAVSRRPRCVPGDLELSVNGCIVWRIEKQLEWNGTFSQVSVGGRLGQGPYSDKALLVGFGGSVDSSFFVSGCGEKSCPLACPRDWASDCRLAPTP